MKAFIFSGHMVDAPGRKQPRFPASLERVVALEIQTVLRRLRARRGDIAVVSGAAGGDILFAEAALATGLTVRLFLPLPEAEFIAESVAFAGVGWAPRYRAVAHNAQTTVSTSHPSEGESPFGACNTAMVACALGLGADSVACILLWDGLGGDGPGGTGHMAALAAEHGIATHVIDIIASREARSGPA
ncbi:MAG: hypothetical protein ACKVVT_09540 [Dehalococcoidia bacterium]